MPHFRNFHGVAFDFQSGDDDTLDLVVDDGASDQGVEAWLHDLGDPRVAYHRNPGNLGMVPTWNACLDLARGELVTLLHADDLLRPGYAELMLGLAELHPRATAFCCEAEIVDARGVRTFSLADARWVAPFSAG